MQNKQHAVPSNWEGYAQKSTAQQPYDRSLIFNFQKHDEELEKYPINLNLEGNKGRNFISTRSLGRYPCLVSAHAKLTRRINCSSWIVFYIQFQLHKAGSSLPICSANGS